MRSLALSSASFSCRRAHRNARYAPHCDALEFRQLLSTGLAGLAAGAVLSSGGASHAAAALGVALSSNAGVVSQAGSPGGASTSQVTYLLNDYQYTPIPLNASVGLVATTAPPSGNSSINGTGVNLTLTNLSVTALNPDTTSSTAAITDEQVNSDAYLIPSTTDLLDDHLGVRYTPPAPRASMTSSFVSNQGTSGSSITNPGRNPVPRLGQPGPGSGIDTQSSESVDFSEPPEAAPPAEAQPVEPVPQGGQAPATTPATTPQPAPRGGQAPAPAPPPEPQPGAQGGQAPAQGKAPEKPAPPIGDSGDEATLDLSDAGVLTCSRDGNVAHAGSQPSDTDFSRSYSVMFGAAVAATGGLRLVLREADRLQGSIPRWSGAERPARRKTRETPRQRGRQ